MTKYPSDEEEDYAQEEEDFSHEEEDYSELDSDPEIDEWLRGQRRQEQQLEEYLAEVEAKRLLALEEEKVAAQELSCKELKLEAGRAESSSDGGSKNLASSTAEGGHKPRDVVPNLKKGVDTPQAVQGYEVVPVMHRVPEKDWGLAQGVIFLLGGGTLY
ncbi:hypothetical protein NDU88_010549 [Pleurodeles waltl]|uniref:Uncharacterized protein n=1 Tax=Pleurodeles waltl TaxID=8319 RepID=A0AAV7QW10_PLEWA|nr:hypothetical protein NDU88_010549 [Pleurodeles waltl]